MPALLVPAGQLISPLVPQGMLAVGPNFERFDGLDIPDTNPATADPTSGGTGMGADYGMNVAGHYPRPGNMNTPVTEQVYTPGPLRGTVGTVDGQPLGLVTGDRIHRPGGAYSQSRTHSIQFRQGVPQASNISGIGAQQTVTLSEITSNPPQPGDITSIIAGLA